MSPDQSESRARLHRSRHPLRVFLSYARSDSGLLERVVPILRDAGMVPVWDTEVQPGTVFTDGIKRRIATSHVFMPLLTCNSANRPWIHQEIGFALGINVPVVPLALGVLPGEMIEGLQAVVAREDLSDLIPTVGQLELEELVLNTPARAVLETLAVTVQVADFAEERTRNLVGYARTVPRPSRVRQRGIFSSFSLPDADASDPMWDTIDLPRRRSDYFRDLLRDERRVLEAHARAGGCSLILRPFLDYHSVGAKVHRQQLELLVAFLQSMPEELVTVAITDTGDHGNLTLVGDWFGARALPPKPGSEYRETLFCHHGPSVLIWLRQFDDEIASILHADRVEPHESRDRALTKIRDRLKQLPSE